MSEEMMRRRVMMAIAQGGGGGSSLPSEYQEVEYIQSNGSQYIDTGIYGNAGIKISARMAWVTASNTLLGSRKDAGATRFFITAYNGIDFGYGNDKIVGIQIVTGQIYDFIYDTSAAPNAVETVQRMLKTRILIGDLHRLPSPIILMALPRQIISASSNVKSICPRIS